MPKKKSSDQKSLAQSRPTELAKSYDALLRDAIKLLHEARRKAARAVNSVMTATYWSIGQRIVELEQDGKERAEYGAALLQRLAEDLTERFGRGFSSDNLENMRRFYLTYADIQISETLSRKFDVTDLASHFPLSWSHYVALLSASSPEARKFYEDEALRGGWSIRQLKRQMNSMFFERTLLSKNKAAMLTKHTKPMPKDAVTPEEEIKDPLVLEFLGLKDEYSESQLEEALIAHMEAFLLELGGDFTFVGRQKRLRIDDQWFRIDLLFFHRKLRCLVIIDLKLGKFTYADAGQMHMYLNYARENWTNPDENPPIGIILCEEKSAGVVHYTLDNLPNKILAAEYKTALPDEKLAKKMVRLIPKLSWFIFQVRIRPPKSTYRRSAWRSAILIPLRPSSASRRSA